MAHSDPATPSLESTARLLLRVRDGDETARNHLLARYRPMLMRWAHNRLPHAARDLSDTADIVQMSLIRSLDRLGSFEYRNEGAFLAYLRTVLANLLRDEARRAKRRPEREPLSDEIPDSGPTPLDHVFRGELHQRYQRALSRLAAEQQEALLMSIEFGCSPSEIAVATGRPSPGAARVYVARAMIRLAEEMKSDGEDSEG